MVDNFKQIRDLLDFRTDDDFFFVSVYQRKKDFKDGQKVNGTNNNSRLIKPYYIKSLDHLDFVEKEIKELCHVFNARAGINLNRRSFKKTALHHLKKVTDQLINGDEIKAYKAYSSVVGAYSQDTDKKWIIDLDGEEENSFEFVDTLVHEFLHDLQPFGDKFIARIPTKNGSHLITSPFDRKAFSREYPNLDIHTNNPTHLFSI